MIIHYIILSSSYSTKRRIALHFTFKDEVDVEYVKFVRDKIDSAFNGKPPAYSVHVKQTEKETWDSVCETDSYFQGVALIDSVEEFIELVRRDRRLKGVDVAKYILSRTRCTHTRLEKLTYLCYADYLCSTGKSLFDDAIFAFDYGPVVESVYDKYCSYSKDHAGCAILDVIFEDEEDIDVDYNMRPIRSRILFAEDGQEKVVSIDKTLERYGGLDGRDLVQITHREGSPWSRVDRTGRYDRLDDRLILEHHQVEYP